MQNQTSIPTTNESQSLKRDAVMEAYQNLPLSAREQVDLVAEAIVDGVKSNRSRVPFSHAMAIELIGVLGMFLCHRDQSALAIRHVGKEEMAVKFQI